MTISLKCVLLFFCFVPTADTVDGGETRIQQTSHQGRPVLTGSLHLAVVH